MSHKYFDLVRHVPDLTPAQAFVLYLLADHANKEGLAFPGVKLLARETRLSERHVYRALHQLESRQLIASSQGSKDTRFRTVYSMTFADQFLILEKEVHPATVPPTNGHTPHLRADPLSPPPLTPDPVGEEEIKRRRAMMQVKLAEIAAKKRPEKLERPGRAERKPDKTTLL